MTEDKKPETPDWFNELFRVLVRSFQPRHVTNETRTAYYAALRELPEQALRAALSHLLRRQFFPTSEEWRNAATTWMQQKREQMRRDQLYSNVPASLRSVLPLPCPYC